MADVNRGIASGALDTEYIRQQSIDRLDADLLIGDSVTPGTLPKNGGSTLVWTLNEHLSGRGNAYDRYQALTQASGTMESTYSTRATNEVAWAPTTTSRLMNYYGEFVPVRQVDLDWMPRSVMDDLADSVGFAGAETMNGLDSAQVDGRGAADWEPVQGAGTTNILAANAATLGAMDSGDKLGAQDLFTIKGSLKAANVRPFKDGYYRAYVHPAAAVHLQTEVDAAKIVWSEIVKYVSGRTGQLKAVNGEVGAVGGVMVFETSDIYESIDNAAIYVYHNMVVGKDCIGGARMGDMDVKVLINRSDATSIDDPYRMFATVAYRLKAAEIMLRTEACWMIKSYASG